MHTQRLKSIEGGRFVGAITVIVWHLNDYVDPYLPFSARIIFRGEWANIFFFMLSGFFAASTLTSNQDKRKVTIEEYVIKRIKKIYPLWAGTTLFFLLLSVAEMRIRHEGQITLLIKKVVVDLLLVQSWIPGYQYLFDLNGPGWFLSALLLCWIFTIPLRDGFKRVRRKETIIIFIICMQLLFDIIKSNSNALQRFATGIFWIYPITAYAIGMLWADVHDIYKCKKKHMELELFVLLPMCYFVTFFVAPLENAWMLYWTILLLQILLEEKGVICHVLASKPFVVGGGYSFEIYLLHIPVTRLLGFFGFIHSNIIVFLSAVILTFFSSFVYRKCFYFSK